MQVSFIVSLLEKLSSMKKLKQTQALVIKTGLISHSCFQAKLLTFCALSTSGSIEYAEAIFQDIATTFAKMKNPFLFNTMIRAYSQSVFPIKAILIYNHMHRINVKSDCFTFPFVFKACARVSSQDDSSFSVIATKGTEIHCRALKSGLYLGDFAQNSLLHMYSRCGLLHLARAVFDEMSSQRTIASWNTMIAAYDRVNDFDSADSLHRLIPERNVVSWNTLIARRVKQRNLEAAVRIFEEMPERDTISWNSIIAGYIQEKDYKGALQLFRQMQISGVQVTEATLVSVLRACAETGALMIGKEIHDSLKYKEFKIQGVLGTALVDMYAKCGTLTKAREVFNGMEMKHVSCWNSMIMALAVHGYSKEALLLFSAMENRCNDAIPNRITFITILIACSHKGLVEQGYRYFHRMTEYYKIKPDIKHYGCMVDMLSRWGLLHEAYHIIKTMPYDANSVLWRTLLSSCKTHGNVKLAEEVFQQISKLEPPSDGDRVLLSNIYAESERWEDVELVRNDMIDLGVSKKPGSSQVEVK